VLLRNRSFWFRGLSHLSWGYRGTILLLLVQLLGLIWSPNQWVNIATAINSHLEISSSLLSVFSKSWVGTVIKPFIPECFIIIIIIINKKNSMV
jgi:hypothetical protein